ncbi:DNA repair protein RecO [Alicyclobacillus tolerans]|uniref:DNA repair protein RecO n=1 Tax=Alicyclobacillus tolerans TaxID=90970 RepID=UPI001EFFEAD8|nr:DNA repair protein RecO [Alicyclobacillus tolerans]MCF8563343.1 DNA repair protein RecO [Alicyclobacillus tolerans]
MLYNTNAVVIRSIAYGETHAIVTLLTPSGTVAAMARGAKKPQSRLASGIQLCVEGIYSIYQRTGMGSVQQVEIVNSRRVLREDLESAAYAAYFCELVGMVAQERPNGSEAVFRLFSGALERLIENRADVFFTARTWEAKILRWLGASPNWMDCVLCHERLTGEVFYSPGEGGFVCTVCERTAYHSHPQRRALRVPQAIPRILETMTQLPWERFGKVSLSQASRQALQTVLKIQLTEYAGVFAKSRSFLDSLEQLP